MATGRATGSQIRDLLRQIEGVLEVEVEEEPEGGIHSIDIQVADPGAARRITRDVESALQSSLGITVDHRAVRVTYNGHRPRTNGRESPPLPTSPAHSLQLADIVSVSEGDPEAAESRRTRLMGVRCAPDGKRYVEITVELESRGTVFSGRVRDADTSKSRILATGRATLEALSGTFAEDTAIALEGIEDFAISDERALLAVLSARIGHERPVFHGAALIRGDVLEAAARAVLDALNRFWAARGGAR